MERLIFICFFLVTACIVSCGNEVNVASNNQMSALPTAPPADKNCIYNLQVLSLEDEFKDNGVIYFEFEGCGFIVEHLGYSYDKKMYHFPGCKNVHDSTYIKLSEIIIKD